MTTQVLSLSGVGIWFDTSPPTQICSGLDLDLSAGSFHCFAGRSGSGKTSILRVAAGLATPKEGTVTWRGRNIADWGEDQRARARRDLIGYADQSTVVVPGFTTWENVILPAVPGRRTKKYAARAAELLELVGLSDRLLLAADKLSGGERQRTVLARAMLLTPPLLILDEPTASLDRATADRLITNLQDYCDDGGTVLCASHDPHVIDQAQTVTELE